MSAPITEIFPGARAVVLGGRTFLVGEVRLCDVVALQDWLDKGCGSPLDSIRSSLPVMSPTEQRNALEAAWEIATAGPPVWGEERGDLAYNTGAGIVQIFRVILRNHQPELTDAEIEDIAEKSTMDEYMAMRRVWRRMNPVEEIEWMLNIHPLSEGGEITWAQAIVELAEETGWTLEYIKSLTFSQFRLMRSGGKPREPGGTPVVNPKGGKLKAMVAAMKAMRKNVMEG